MKVVSSRIAVGDVVQIECDCRYVFHHSIHAPDAFCPKCHAKEPWMLAWARRGAPTPKRPPPTPRLPDPPVAPRTPVEATIELWRPPNPPAADDPIPF